MENFFLHNVRTLFLFLIPSFIVYLFTYDWYWVFITYLLCVIFWLLFHFFSVYLLIRWLRKPSYSKVPKSFGIWQEIFSILRSRTKSRKNRKKKINIILQRFYKVVSLIPSGVIILSHENRIEWMNSVAESHFNLSIAENLNDVLVDLLRDNSFENYLLSESSDPFILKIPANNNQDEKILSINIGSFTNNKKIIFSEDITKEDLIKQSKNNFIVNVSKNLDIPLKIIDDNIKILHKSIEKDDKNQIIYSVNNIDRQNNKMQLLIKELILLAHIDNGLDISLFKKINISDLCMKIIGDIKTIIKNDYELKYSIEKNIIIQAEEESIYMALKNIVINAIQYSNINSTIDINLGYCNNENKSLDNQNLDVFFQVKDSGIGVAKEHIPYLTERFYQVSKSYCNADFLSGGTGLGLAITKEYIEDLGGEINISSDIGKGTTVNIYLKQLEE